ncbi:MAG: PilZ domain-containing protein [Planctomycetota bacterium]
MAEIVTRAGGDERRLFPRAGVERLCKIQRPGDARYLSAFTHDVGEGGALIEILTRDPVAAGESIRIGVSWDHRPLIKREALVPAVVVRAEPLGSATQRVAIRFVESQAEAGELVRAASPSSARAA